MHLKCCAIRAMFSRPRGVASSRGWASRDSGQTPALPDVRVASADRSVFESFFLRGQGLLLRSIYSMLAVTFRGYVTAQLTRARVAILPFRRFNGSRHREILASRGRIEATSKTSDLAIKITVTPRVIEDSM